MNSTSTTSIPLYRSTPTACSYLSERESNSIFCEPKTNALYDLLIQHGFRRSGGIIYRPHCTDCQACVSVRVLSSDFQQNRSQRRTMKRNEDLNHTWVDGQFTEEYYALYQTYINHRHGEGGMENPTRASFSDFLLSDWSRTLFLEVRDHNATLLAVAVTDVTDDGLSALYTFFNPEMPKRALGVYCILQQINACKRQQRPYLYLGYWIHNCKKMDYKVRYQPLEGFINNGWRRLTIDNDSSD